MTEPTQSPHNTPQPTPPLSSGDHSAGLFDQQTITFIALIAFPILALVSAAMGLIFILQGHTVAGVLFILVIAQVFIFGGLWAYRKRQSGLSHSGKTKKPLD